MPSETSEPKKKKRNVRKRVSRRKSSTHKLKAGKRAA